MLDVAGQIREALLSMVTETALSVADPVMDALGQTVLSTPDLTSQEQVTSVWTTNLVVANALFVLFVVAAGYLLMTGDTLQGAYDVTRSLPRLLLAPVLSNISLIVCAHLIEATNDLTAVVAGEGVTGAVIVTSVTELIQRASTALGVLSGLLTIIICALAIAVVITLILRVAGLAILIMIAPLALLCHALPHTEALANTWWRAVAACLGIQLAQAIIIVIAANVILTPDGATLLGLPASTNALVGLLLCLAVLWLLVKVPGWSKHLILGPLGHGRSRGPIGQVLHTIVTIKTLGALTGLSPATGMGLLGRARGLAHQPRAAQPRTPTPRSPRSPRPWRRPRPVGPAAFSDQPSNHPPPPRTTGQPAPAPFSHAIPPSPTAPKAATPPPETRFSHHRPAAPPRPTPTSPPEPARFSDRTRPAAMTPPTQPTGVTSTPAFSSAPRGQTAPRRFPAPVAPVFSHNPTTPQPATRRRSTARRRT